MNRLTLYGILYTSHGMMERILVFWAHWQNLPGHIYTGSALQVADEKHNQYNLIDNVRRNESEDSTAWQLFRGLTAGGEGSACEAGGKHGASVVDRQ